METRIVTMLVVSFYVNTLRKSIGKSWGHSGPSEKLLTLSSYRPCDRIFLDMYHQVTTHKNLDPELSQITQTRINQKFVTISFGLSIKPIEPRWEDYRCY